MVHFPETYSQEYFTTARIITDTTTREPKSADWLWINPNSNHRFSTAESAQEIVNLSNANGKDTGLDIDNFPYFAVRVLQTSKVERLND